MAARLWILVLATWMAAGTTGCGSCRWHHRNCGIPSSCVVPFCDDPACQVCSPVPPLYDGWTMQGFSGGCSCGMCPGMSCDPCGDSACGECVTGSCPSGGCPTGDCRTGSCPTGTCPTGDCTTCGPEGGSCGYPMTASGYSMENCAPGNFAGGSSMYSPPSEPVMAAPPTNEVYEAPPAEYRPSPNAIPMRQTIPDDGAAPEPPMATPTFGVQPSEYYAPNKRSAGIPAPLTSSGPVRLKAPPAIEPSMQLLPVEQASLRLPPLP